MWRGVLVGSLVVTTRVVHPYTLAQTPFPPHTHTQLLYPGDVEQQRLVLSAGRVADESPLMAGFPLEFVNALDIGADGTVFFSHSSDVIPYK